MNRSRIPFGFAGLLALSLFKGVPFDMAAPRRIRFKRAGQSEQDAAEQLAAAEAKRARRALKRVGR